jgi:hypothetical protein
LISRFYISPINLTDKNVCTTYLNTHRRPPESPSFFYSSYRLPGLTTQRPQYCTLFLSILFHSQLLEASKSEICPLSPHFSVKPLAPYYSPVNFFWKCRVSISPLKYFKQFRKLETGWTTCGTTKQLSQSVSSPIEGEFIFDCIIVPQVENNCIRTLRLLVSNCASNLLTSRKAVWF